MNIWIGYHEDGRGCAVLANSYKEAIEKVLIYFDETDETKIKVS